MVVQVTNSLILLWPDELFTTRLQPLFKAHFSTYGQIVLWTPLRKLGRVLLAYEQVESAVEARTEMDGFIWQEDDDTSVANGGHDQREPEPMRVFFGPQLTLPLPDLKSTLLSVPQLSKNFLISPPGSPPIGWEQILEERPNPNPLPVGQDSTEGGGDDDDGGWADELAKALRYLSTQSNEQDEDQDNQNETNDHDDDDDTNEPSTTVLIPAVESAKRPAITVSSPTTLAQPSPGTSTPPPPGATKIESVKATIESMLGKKRSFSDLSSSFHHDEMETSFHVDDQDNEEMNESGRRTPMSRIRPTARPPL
ncbi:hypothetical protein OIO90_004120 [Microbotryomycetes sp. JL221]|nr:hypothetical protein OIO90_004120 [Microbotryomycetes sp. JL221]